MLFLVSVSAAYANPCIDQEDGTIPEWGCKSYTYCYMQNPIQIDCTGDLVFNIEIGKCDE